MLAKKVAEILFPPMTPTLAFHIHLHSDEEFALALKALVGCLLSSLPNDGLTV